MSQTKTSKAEKLFQGRKLVIGTKHDKEKVIAPVIEKIIGVTCFASQNFDTDNLGTFTGEIERPDDPLTTVRRKCLAAMVANDCDLGIASEGSFGSHPESFFLPADDELMVFIDKKNGVEVIARELSTSTNFNSQTINSEEQLVDFAQIVGFPAHALILRRSHKDNAGILKGIRDWGQLKADYRALSDLYGEVFAETDMRAMHNPTQMKVIAGLTEKLANNIMSVCPECDMPGFNVTEVKRGLPCEYCHSPTRSVLSYVFECKHCHHIDEKMHPEGKRFCDPMYCDYCNP